jgi:hypothetical protein
MRFKDYLLEAKRTTPELFIQMVRDAAPDNITKLTIVDLKKIAADNDVQVPTAIYHNPDLKNGPHMWNFSGGNADDADVDQKVSDDLGVEVDGDSKKDTEEYKKLARLNRAQEISRLAAGGKIYLFGRKPKGAFFRIPNAEEVTAQLERMLSRELANSGDASMEEQYELLIDKVKLVAGGQSKFIKSILITGAPSSGKALALDTPIPSPTGWTTMGDIEVGDTIFDEHGNPTKVTFATEVQLNRDCFEVEFDDDHRWFTHTGAESSVVNTLKISETVQCNYVIENCGPVVEDRIVTSKTIIGCTPVPSVPVRCITVDSPSHLFLCSRSYIPTHNTHTVMQAIKGLGLVAGEDYTVKKGKTTQYSLFRTLIEQLNGLTIFDDADSCWSDENSVNILKSSLDTTPVREISNDGKNTINTAVLSTEERDKYCEALSRALRNKQTDEDMRYFHEFFQSTGGMPKLMKKLGRQEKDENGNVLVDNDSLDDIILDHVKTTLPNKVDYRGRIIFISNLAPDELDSAVMTRAFTQNMDFRSDEMLDFIDKIKDHIEASISDEQKQEVMDYVRELWKTGKLKSAVNFRLIQQAFDLRLTSQWMKILSQM